MNRWIKSANADMMNENYWNKKSVWMSLLLLCFNEIVDLIVGFDDRSILFLFWIQNFRIHEMFDKTIIALESGIRQYTDLNLV